MDAVGKPRDWQKQPTAQGATIGMTGTIQTVFGAMRVGVTEEVKRLDELVRLNKLLVENTRTQALVP